MSRPSYNKYSTVQLYWSLESICKSVTYRLNGCYRKRLCNWSVIQNYTGRMIQTIFGRPLNTFCSSYISLQHNTEHVVGKGKAGCFYGMLYIVGNAAAYGWKHLQDGIHFWLVIANLAVCSVAPSPHTCTPLPSMWSVGSPCSHLSVSAEQSIDDIVRTPTHQRRAQTQGGTSALGLITGCTHGAPERMLFFRPITYKADKYGLYMTRCWTAAVDNYFPCTSAETCFIFAHVVHIPVSRLLPCLLGNLIKSIVQHPDSNFTSRARYNRIRWPRNTRERDWSGAAGGAEPTTSPGTIIKTVMWKQISLPRCCSKLCWEKNRNYTHTHTQTMWTSQFKTTPAQPWNPPHELYLMLCWGLDTFISELDALHLFIMLQLVIWRWDFQCCREQDSVVWNNGSVHFTGQVTSVLLPRTKDLQRRHSVLIHLASLMMWVSISRK